MALSDGDARSGVTMARRLGVSRFWLALACVLFSAPIAANETAEPSATELIEGLLSGREPVGGPFELTDQTGHRRTDADFQGKLVVIYFGYTYCPDVCPTELQSISLALDKLGAAADTVQPLFITVDPGRDTPARLADFVSSFHPRLIGLTGSLAEIRKTAIAYRTFFAKNGATTADHYSVDHTGFIYLLGKDGRYLGFLPPSLSPDAIADAIRARLGAK
ncbi:SCO family protein [Bradyrhizobium sp. McL0615]|uniref:SCO family protein n=1 Tax=Bradyrhizobium sp. McL0615 TaxID=3415673 RepID=UPI003CF1045E